MAENEGAGGGEKRVEMALATMLQVYFETLREEPLPGRLVETVRELAASSGGAAGPTESPHATLQ